MIAVHVRDQQMIDVRRAESGGGEPGAESVTAIHHQLGVAELIMERRVTAIGAGPPVPDTKTPESRLGLSI